MTNIKIIGIVVAFMSSTIFAQLTAPYNVFADGNELDVYGDGSLVAPAVQWTWLDDNVASGDCADGSAALADCVGTLFCNAENPYTSYDCYVNDGTCADLNGDGIITDWLGDTYCDDGAFGVNFQCDEYGWDCGDCGDPIVDPNGYCDEAPPVSCEDQGLITCPDGSCANSFDDCPESLLDCDGTPFTEEYLSWIGDGYCDGTTVEWGLNFACAEFDCDGCDCVGDPGQTPECATECGGEAVSPGAEKELFSDNSVSSSNPKRISPSFNVETGEYNPGNMVSSRLISFVVTVTVNSGTYAGSSFDFDANQPEINIYGFGLGDDVCGFVTTLDGGQSSPASCEACALAGIPTEGEPCDAGGGGVDECADYDVAGDVNNDDDVNVLDIVSVVNHILGDELVGCEFGAADLNGDEGIDVLDIVNIVNIILGGRGEAATSATFIKTNSGLEMNANGVVDAVQITLIHGDDFSIELNKSISDLDIAVASEPRNNETTFIVVAPRDGEIARISGEYAIKEDGLLAANSNGYIATSMPTAFGLSEAYPNPFNPSTTLNFTLDADGSVAINVYNVMGQMVGTLHNGNMSAGTHSLTWDASDLSSGIYLVRAESAGNIATQKVMLMK